MMMIIALTLGGRGAAIDNSELDNDKTIVITNMKVA